MKSITKHMNNQIIYIIVQKFHNANHICGDMGHWYGSILREHTMRHGQQCVHKTHHFSYVITLSLWSALDILVDVDL